MGFKETVLNAIKTGVALAAALVFVVVLLAGSVQICLCDPDPDNCGRPCHVCVDEPCVDEGVYAGEDSSPIDGGGGFNGALLSVVSAGEDSFPIDGATFHHEEHACNHVTLALGDQLSVSTDVPVPLVGNFPAGSWALTLSTPPVRWMRPCSTAPPDSGGGGYLLYATRIHPRA